MNHLKRYLECESGATAIEYGLIAVIVSISIVAAATGIGDQLVVVFERIAMTLRDAVT